MHFVSRLVLLPMMVSLFSLAAARADDGTADMLYKMGKEKYDAKAYADAEVLLKKAIEENKKHLQAWFLLAKCAHAQDKAKPAKDAADECRKLLKDKKDLTAEEQQMLQELAALEQPAGDAGGELAALNRETIDSLLATARALLDKKKTLAARQAIEAVLAIEPGNADALELRKTIFAGTKRRLKLFNGANIDNWTLCNKRDEEVVILNQQLTVRSNTSGWTRIVCNDFDAQGDFLLSARIRVGEEENSSRFGGCGFILGYETEEGSHIVMQMDQATISLCTVRSEAGFQSKTPFADYSYPSLLTVNEFHEIQVDVRAGNITVLVDGKETLKFKADPADLTGRVGILVENARSVYEQIEVISQ